LHKACYSGVVTNLDLVEFLLEAGANPNAQDNTGEAPLMFSLNHVPGAAKFLVNWSTTDVNVLFRSGESSFLIRVRSTITTFSCTILLSGCNPLKVQHQFLLQQWRDIEEMLVEMGAHHTGIAPLL
jgi:hypothetical protein